MKLVILDRDGVINYDSVDYIKSPEEWHAIPGSLEAIASLNKAGIKVAIASNQSGLARGYFTEATLQNIHRTMSHELAQYGGHIDKIFYCPHMPDDGCECRKPKPGLLLQACDYFKVKPAEASFVGDTEKDVIAAKAAGCQPILVETGKVPLIMKADYANLFDYVQSLLGNNS